MCSNVTLKNVKIRSIKKNLSGWITDLHLVNSNYDYKKSIFKQKHIKPK